MVEIVRACLPQAGEAALKDDQFTRWVVGDVGFRGREGEWG